jgi:hypothetical protein
MLLRHVYASSAAVVLLCSVHKIQVEYPTFVLLSLSESRLICFFAKSPRLLLELKDRESKRKIDTVQSNCTAVTQLC